MGSFFKASVQSEMQYRANFIGKLLVETAWYAGQIIAFEAIYSFTPVVNGWTVQMVRVFLGIVFVSDCLWMLFFDENFARFSTKVTTGELDLLLTKPVDAQFMMTTQKMNASYLLNISVTLTFLSWAVMHLPVQQTVQVYWLFLLVPIGVLIQYSIRTFILCMTLIFTNAQNLQFIWYTLMRFGTRPDAFFPTKIRWLLLTVLPVAFLASVPARFLFGLNETWLIGFVLVVPALFLAGARWMWTSTLNRYTSASS